MESADFSRLYIEFAPSETLLKLYREGTYEAFAEYITASIGLPGIIPSPPMRRRLVGADIPTENIDPSRLVVGLKARNDGSREAAVLIKKLKALKSQKPVDGKYSILDWGADPGIDLADCWCPGESSEPVFGSRDDADRLINADYLRRKGATGLGVNVVVVDQGLDRNYIPNYGGGWDQVNKRAGMTAGGHGMMVARSILSLAPDVRLFDCPLIPDTISDVTKFLYNAADAITHVLDGIKVLRKYPKWQGPWIISNSWAVYDRSTETPPGDYTNRPDHPFNLAMERASQDDIDVVFASGNCGQMCPKSRCGSTDTGPGNSIFGANSHPDVLSVGAVRADAMWVGFSSQGPGQNRLSRKKPDLCAPTHFAETDDAMIENTGSSTSCAIVAGALAALRSRWGTDEISPSALRRLVIKNLISTPSGKWERNLGHGILDARAIYKAAEKAHP